MEAILNTIMPLAVGNDGLLVGLGLGCIAINLWMKFFSHRKAYKEIKAAPVVEMSQLPAVLANLLSKRGNTPEGNETVTLPQEKYDTITPSVKIPRVPFWLSEVSRFRVWPLSVEESALNNLLDGLIKTVILMTKNKPKTYNQLVVVRGRVQVRDAVHPFSVSKIQLLDSDYSKASSVVVENNLKPTYLSLMRLNPITLASMSEDIVATRKIIPFVLDDIGSSSSSPPFTFISAKNSSHNLPLTRVYTKISVPGHNVLSLLWQNLLIGKLRVASVVEESILPVNSELTAVGYLEQHSSGKPEIRPVAHLPYFLTKHSPEQLVVGMAMKCKLHFLLSFAATAAAVVIIGFSTFRNWRTWQHNIGSFFGRLLNGERNTRGEELRSEHHSNDVSRRAQVEEDSEDEPGNRGVDGDLCVICLTRRRRTLFVNCCHRVCCRQCASGLLDRDSRCPICRQEVVRIYTIFDA